MKIKTEKYRQACDILPKAGQIIIGHQQEDEIVVYQAYKASIATYAVQHQALGGPEYSYRRMSWIKPNFLWMMFRCGWAEKENQDRVLALWIRKSFLEEILSDAVASTYDAELYPDRETWRRSLEQNEVRLQWDPDHDPYGAKLTRRAIQLGLKGGMLERFGKQELTGIEDVTDFVREQKQHVDTRRLDLLEVPEERIWQPESETLTKNIGIGII